MNVYGYARVSGKTQLNGDGFPRQESAIESFVRTHGLTMIGAPWREEGVSGTVEGLDRPAFAEMLSFLDKHSEPDSRIEAIIVERMDRLARDLMVSEVLLAELRRRDIKVFSADQGQLIDMASDGGDPTRVLIRQIMGALAQWEKTMLVKKLRAAKDRLKAAGKLVEGATPFGQLPGEAGVLRLMLDSHPEMNYSQITEMMNSMSCLNRAGRAWKPQNVRDIIINARKKKGTTK